MTESLARFLTKLSDSDEITHFDGTTQQERNFSGFYSKKKNITINVPVVYTVWGRYKVVLRGDYP